jgi:hypothetical protein
MMRVEIFRTFVNNEKQARKICEILNSQLENTKVNFDLDDCDKVLRVESPEIDINKIRWIMENLGYSCDLIPGST